VGVVLNESVHANLIFANLTGANLTNANLTGSNLTGSCRTRSDYRQPSPFQIVSTFLQATILPDFQNRGGY